jgi:hypothetical protein
MKKSFSSLRAGVALSALIMAPWAAAAQVAPSATGPAGTLPNSDVPQTPAGSSAGSPLPPEQDDVAPSDIVVTARRQAYKAPRIANETPTLSSIRSLPTMRASCLTIPSLRSFSAYQASQLSDLHHWAIQTGFRSKGRVFRCAAFPACSPR